ncbi:ABC transporter transmembrane region 2 family protein [Candida parapsilosis]|uniref:ABC transporter transmembrane region 2 family protein n=1 Tax=Candida parapsilosis TaxID=5480 RepID=A0A8X7NMW0_CANPA|nr:ABC transporter transmembrane region 2 family protein [Candida parapsilosis]KAF6052655.1 ABC transporter transmembrane region 2 family protein [Candida parapsilosis]KAF6053650.1 ABC transporter transmembrane region 2 family protein [Candida parapsilosis]KAF6064432.1 ABC transporter transmembrane region 2 family protein [Candida parapsilosis]KAI5903946.1 Peroxisomal long-chain fatty acid import protein 1 [Candida parapsilosis]
MSVTNSRLRDNSLALSLLKVYRSNRSLLLNTSYIILITAAFSGAASTGSSSSSSSSSEKSNDKSQQQQQVDGSSSSNKKSAHPKLSRQAFDRLFHAIIPTFHDKTVGYFIAHLVLLVTRAFLTLRVATLDGQLVGALVSKRLKVFSRYLLAWMLIGIPASLNNALLSWTKQNMRKAIRENLNNSILKDYLPDNLDTNYYSLIHLSGNKITDPNQRITTDVSRLASALSSLPGQLLKPTLDLVLCARQLSKSGVGNGEGTLALGILAHFSTMIIRFFSPPFAKLASERANLEGKLRSAHSKIVSNNEEIAFLRGHYRELDYIDYCYYTLERFSKQEYWKKGIHEIAQTFIVKYFWGAAGLVLCSSPIFIAKYLGEEDDNNAAGKFITNRRLLLSASDSLDRLIYARRYLLQIVGHATRVSDFQDTLADVASRRKDITSNVKYNNDAIIFDKVRLLTPADVTLIESLSFSIKSGDHLLIAGPNGSGKSSLFRMLGGLWPVKEGTITIPTAENMFYIPQRAYLLQGTLKEQIIYPHPLNKQTKSDKELQSILRILKLDDFVDQLNEVKNWDEELSTGAQQRLAMARLYYHEPKFAVLDECTSAVSPDMEQFMYEHAQSLGITLLSVAHRPALWHFHKYLLKFDGKGGYYFGKLDAERRLKLEKERVALEKVLRDIPMLKERLAELKNVSKLQHQRYEKKAVRSG